MVSVKHNVLFACVHVREDQVLPTPPSVSFICIHGQYISLVCGKRLYLTYIYFYGNTQRSVCLLLHLCDPNPTLKIVKYALFT